MLLLLLSQQVLLLLPAKQQVSAPADCAAARPCHRSNTGPNNPQQQQQ
jgi:hypothetical protein